MIPEEVAAIADLIHEGWQDMEDNQHVLAAAWRIYNAGYRKTDLPGFVYDEDGH